MQKSFILGNPRSGTTVLRLILNAHPKIAATPECGFMQWWFDKYQDWDIDCSHSTKKIKEFVNDILDSRKVETWNLNREALILRIEKEKPASYADLSLQVYEQWADQNKKKPVLIVDKNNYYIHHLKTISTIWRDAKYIFIVRDGRDVVCSYRRVNQLESSAKYLPKLPTEIDKIAKEWIFGLQNVEEFLSSKKISEYITIRYEDLMSTPEIVLSEVLELFDLSYRDKMLRFHSISVEPKETLAWKTKTKEELDLSRIGLFKKKLSNNEVSRFEQIAKDKLLKYGYRLTL